MSHTKITAEHCRQCGLCCVAPHDQDVFADVTERDVKRLNRRWAARNVVSTNLFNQALAMIDGYRLPYAAIRTRWNYQCCGPLKGTEACMCAALKGSLLHRTSCTIYERRPQICRTAVKPGGRACRQIRKAGWEMADDNTSA